MAEVEVRAFGREDRRQWEVFLRLPRKLHYGERYWVPEFLVERRRQHDPRLNPELADLDVRYFLAYRQGEPLGRIAAFRRQADRDGTGWFGFFECEDDPGGAQALFDAAGTYLAERGCTRMRGPSGYTAMTALGMLVDGRFEDTPTVMMPWNPRYYERMCERAHMSAAGDVLAFELTNWHWPREPVVELARIAREQHGVTLRPLRLDAAGFDQDIDVARELFHSAWADSWGYAPIDAARFAHLARELRVIMHPDLGFVAERDGAPVGLGIGFPDINQLLVYTGARLTPLLWHMWLRKTHLKLGDICTRVRIAMIGVVPEQRGQGIEALLLEHMIENCLNHGVLTMELGWIHEAAAANEPLLAALGALAYKRYRVWERDLSAPDA